ncbi:uncharacterized protein TRAVEDRAFT_66778 [Trametes versicolor FP-101664 SS1]|uniref:uncharacterized protein n=1 Tax=Trametes versicolor (strain FP-101664) TaxID=717944 RepID=UPI0004621632|nr:uncharacterized protein TRAVEDRAFT_66778 [Trametes versicolor FP-101664 SS1]EIW54377.1 hypothetical protein TRAVEDRAFT_66778 [Trametes versicolor FP-101664 SS1]
MHLARLSSGAPLLPYLQLLHLGESSERCEDLRLLVSTTLSELYLCCSFNTRPGSEHVFPSALQDILTNTPSLTYLQLIDFDSRLLTMVAPELLYRLKELEVGARRSMDCGQVPHHGFPDVQSLRIMSTLPKLERLTVDLNFSLAPAFYGFCSLTSLKITDFNHNAAYFLTMCSSPHLRELHLDFWVRESWTGLRTVCSVVAHRAPELRSLTLSFEGLQESEWSPEHTLDAFSSLFALRHLSEVQIRANEGTFEFSDSILAAFAEVWPALARLDICCHPLPIDADDPDLILDFPALAAPPLEPEPEFQSVTLRVLDAFAQHCSGLRTLRLPYLYLAAPGENSHPAQRPDHPLRELLICRCDIADGARVNDLAQAVENMFPHIHVGDSLKESLCYQTPSSSTSGWRDILLAVEERRKERSVA